MSKIERLLLIIVLILNNIYLVWLIFNVSGVLGWLLLAAEFTLTNSFNLFAFNHWGQKSDGRSYRKPEGTLDIFLPVVNEPLDMFEETLSAACNIYYLDKNVYILDDGGREEISQLAEKYNVNYIARSTHEDNKAGNLNYGMRQSDGDFILCLDADQVVKPNIANELLGHFQTNPSLAYVTTSQKYKVPEKDFNNDYMFYLHMQPGKNRDNAAISTGTGVIYNRYALNYIGGFQTWNIVEDLYTSYVLHQNGYKSLYIDKAYTIGTAPADLPMIYKQRGTWAVDTLRVLFKINPLVVKGLTLRQRLHYLEMGLTYIVSAIAIPTTFGILAATEILNVNAIENINTYLLLRLPSLILMMSFFYLQSNKSTATFRYWAALFPLYFTGIWLALRKLKMNYKVTSKTIDRSRSIHLVYPQLALIGLNSTGLIIYIHNHPGTASALNIFWFALICFWFYPVIAKAFLWDPQLRSTKSKTKAQPNLQLASDLQTAV